MSTKLGWTVAVVLLLAVSLAIQGKS